MHFQIYYGLWSLVGFISDLFDILNIIFIIIFIIIIIHWELDFGK